MTALALTSIIIHPVQRFVAQAKATTWTGLRKWAVLESSVVEQDDVLHLVPDDMHMLGVFMGSASLVAIAIGAGIGWFG